MRLQSNNGITSDILGASALVSVPPVAQKSSYKSKFFLLVSLQDASPHYLRFTAAPAFLPCSVQ